MKWKAGLTIFHVLAVVARQSRRGAYLLMEAVSLLLFIAAVLILVVLFLIAFFVLWHGMRSCLFWLKDIARRTSVINSDPISSEKEMRHTVLR